MVLEACRQQVLAARVEREYHAFKDAWDAASANGNVLTRELSDAAEELCATLAALERFKGCLLDSNITTAPSHKGIGARTVVDSKPARRKGRRLEAHLRLKAWLSNREHQFSELVARIMNDDRVALDEFKDAFGPKAMAICWASEEGKQPDGREVNRWSTAIKESSIYQQMIQPLFSKPPQPPVGWQRRSADRHLWDDLL